MKTLTSLLFTIALITIASNSYSQTNNSVIFNNEQAAINRIKLSGETGTEIKCVFGANGPSIKWESQQESNTSHFELQISYDGNEFRTIRNVAASELTAWSTVYEAKFHKNYISAEKVYYRLKTVFIDGSTDTTTPITFTITNADIDAYASIH